MDDFDPELWFHRRASFYVEAQLLYHLSACGVFQSLLAEGAQSPRELAERLDLAPEPLATILEYIAGVDSILRVSAAGQFDLSENGHQVIQRYSRPTPTGPQLNFFDVRVGAYGPIWQGVGRLLRGESEIGVDLHRNGAEAAGGVYTIGAKMAPGLGAVLAGLKPDWVLEFGVTTGILSLLAEGAGACEHFGLDRKASALKGAAARAGPGASIGWIEAELLEVDRWADRLPSCKNPVFFSVHFHEFLAQGEARVQAFLRGLGQRFPGAVVVAIEQPAESGTGAGEVLDLYAQSNRLIHHLIGNGKILSTANWNRFFQGAGAQVRSIESMHYLGYKAFIVEL
jgi:hypothetical protein